jgi:hypothetical protein
MPDNRPAESVKRITAILGNDADYQTPELKLGAIWWEILHKSGLEFREGENLVEVSHAR